MSKNKARPISRCKNTDYFLHSGCFRLNIFGPPNDAIRPNDIWVDGLSLHNTLVIDDVDKVFWRPVTVLTSYFYRHSVLNSVFLRIFWYKSALQHNSYPKHHVKCWALIHSILNDLFRCFHELVVFCDMFNKKLLNTF